MKLARTEDAVGHVLCHDMTRIIRGVAKDARFRKGHIAQPEDIPVLLSVGKKQLYVWVKSRDIKLLDHGGLCLNCPACHYPDCSFGKGV